jgi:hypothetical protein
MLVPIRVYNSGSSRPRDEIDEETSAPHVYRTSGTHLVNGLIVPHEGLRARVVGSILVVQIALYQS